MKRCNKCGLLKAETTRHFEPRQENGNLRGTCRVCRNARPRNQTVRRLNRKRYVHRHRAAIQAYMRSYKRLSDVQLARVSMRVNLLSRACSQCCNTGEFKYRKSICDECYLRHKRAKDSRNSKARRDRDPAAKMREYVSNAIGRALRRARGSKNGESIMDRLPYTMAQLKRHLESLWEPWMSWGNYGSPRLGEHRWHIDHIKPQSLFNFSSMQDQQFLECWSLSNLRPMEAFANMRKSNRLSCHNSFMLTSEHESL